MKTNAIQVCLTAAVFALTGCSGGDGDTGPSSSGGNDCDACAAPGDAEGLPEILGFWTTSFGDKLFDENCGLSDLSQSSETWIKNATMEVKGRVPDTIYADIGGEEYWGAMTNGGGFTLEGIHDSVHGDMHVAIGGLVYYEAYQFNRTVIEGWAFLGLDTLGDGNIDCGARGDFTAILSSR